MWDTPAGGPAWPSEISTTTVWDDLFCTYWGHNILYRNNGDGTFTDVTRKAGLYEERIRWGSGSTFLDYDRDGFLDLFVGNYIVLDTSKVKGPGEPGGCFWRGAPVVCGPMGLPPGMNILYHNNGDGIFTGVTNPVFPLASPIHPGGAWGDFDQDGFLDVFLGTWEMGTNALFHNNGDGTKLQGKFWGR